MSASDVTELDAFSEAQLQQVLDARMEEHRLTEERRLKETSLRAEIVQLKDNVIAFKANFSSDTAQAVADTLSLSVIQTRLESSFDDPNERKATLAERTRLTDRIKSLQSKLDTHSNVISNLERTIQYKEDALLVLIPPPSRPSPSLQSAHPPSTASFDSPQSFHKIRSIPSSAPIWAPPQFSTGSQSSSGGIRFADYMDFEAKFQTWADANQASVADVTSWIAASIPTHFADSLKSSAPYDSTTSIYSFLRKAAYPEFDNYKHEATLLMMQLSPGSSTTFHITEWMKQAYRAGYDDTAFHRRRPLFTASFRSACPSLYTELRSFMARGEGSSFAALKHHALIQAPLHPVLSSLSLSSRFPPNPSLKSPTTMNASPPSSPGPYSPCPTHGPSHTLGTL
ncbi:hypothetical protein BC829DRAFT_447696 [Chytridium lagenaria]|nr:hypothetical protein BC829DRAFT_447696 [Chytridium lagenaria]